ncbi:MAG: ABC transporter ATP-binding protein [Hyphomicrobiaceae bacterium]
MTNLAPALLIRNLYKTFRTPAVDGLSVTIPPGQFYALLGPNGAGKTTTLRMVAGLLTPDAGQIEIAGHDVAQDANAAKRVLAWVPDEPMIYDKLTPSEYLGLVAGLWGMEPATARAKADQLLDVLGLSDNANERCQGFSKGMRQKVALAGALIHEPKLIILDEPLTGLDAGSARQVKSVLRHLVGQGVTVIMTTHILEVAERMADRIGVIARGKLVAEGTFAELRATAGSGEASLEDVFLTLVAERAAGDEHAAAATAQVAA